MSEIRCERGFSHKFNHSFPLNTSYSVVSKIMNSFCIWRNFFPYVIHYHRLITTGHSSWKRTSVRCHSTNNQESSFDGLTFDPWRQVLLSILIERIWWFFAFSFFRFQMEYWPVITGHYSNCLRFRTNPSHTDHCWQHRESLFSDNSVFIFLIEPGWHNSDSVPLMNHTLYALHLYCFCKFTKSYAEQKWTFVIPSMFITVRPLEIMLFNPEFNAIYYSSLGSTL